MGIFNLFKNKEKKLIFNKKLDALTQVFNAYSFFGEEKHTFNNEIINNYCNSNNANDILAVAMSYLGEGAKYRKDAIYYFEKYLENPTSQKYFSNWLIYSSLADLYEKEYVFDKALICLQNLIKLDNNTNCADYTRIGNILTKIDINQAVDYYKSLKKKKIYSQYEEIFDNAYREVLLKKEKGYVYKPRKK